MNIKSPIIAAPMYTASTPNLAAAVTSAGGFGLIGAGFDKSEKLIQDIRSIRSQLKLSAGVPVPVGVGFIGWILDKTEHSDDPRIPAVLDELPVAIWFAFGSDLGKYVSQVRAYDNKRAHTTLVFVIVNSVAEAIRAANEWKVDVLVVQGFEAGGHGSSASPPLFTFVQAVLAAIPDGPPIIAAGGVSTGAQIASLLTLGAAGVALGTRFIFTPECMYTDDMKSVLVDAGLNATARSHAFDEVSGMPPLITWPEGIDGRAIINDILGDYRQGLELEERLKKYNEGKVNGKKERLLIWAGMGAGLVKEIKNASDVLHELHAEAVAALKGASRLLE